MTEFIPTKHKEKNYMIWFQLGLMLISNFILLKKIFPKVTLHLCGTFFTKKVLKNLMTITGWQGMILCILIMGGWRVVSQILKIQKVSALQGVLMEMEEL